MKQKTSVPDEQLVDAALRRRKLIAKQKKRLATLERGLQKTSAKNKQMKTSVQKSAERLEELVESTPEDHIPYVADEKRWKRIVFVHAIAFAVFAVPVTVMFFISPPIAWCIVMIAVALISFLGTKRLLSSESFSSFHWVLLAAATPVLTVPVTIVGLCMTEATPDEAIEHVTNVVADDMYAMLTFILIGVNVVAAAIMIAVQHVRYLKQKKAETRESILKELNTKELV